MRAAPIFALLLAALALLVTAKAAEETLFGTNETYSYTFGEEGTYAYHCHPHPGMKGEVVVTDAADAEEGTAHVTVQHYEYAPASLRVKPGTTVVWTNLDGEAHTVTFDEGHAHHGVPMPMVLAVVGLAGAAALLRARRA